MRDLDWINADNESDGVPALDTHNLTGRVREVADLDNGYALDMDDLAPLATFDELLDCE